VTDWDHRQLCADGSCVGVIGSDGTCKVCGRAAPNWGDERMRGMVNEPAKAAEDAGPVVETTTTSKEEPEEWGDRKLCPDGSCIGVISDDGKCNVCGKAAGSAA
jgi:hypothetical protein